MQPIPTDTYAPKTISADQWKCEQCGNARGAHISGHYCHVNGQLPVFTRERPDFIAMLRIKNEARWIARNIEALYPLVKRIYIMDDHSTDETASICARYDKVVMHPSPFRGFNEARDKNWLFDRIVIDCDPEWIICIDADEILEKDGPRIIREWIAEHPRHAYRLRIDWLWNDENTLRTDRVYGWFWRPSIFKPFNPDHRFNATPWGKKRIVQLPDGTISEESGNLHCSSIPGDLISPDMSRPLNPDEEAAVRLEVEARHGRGQRQSISGSQEFYLPARLWHTGYMQRADRVRKLDYYTSIDWNNRAEDSYRHMCQADAVDISELPLTQDLMRAGELTHEDVRFMLDTPPHASLAHAGPIRLEKRID